jgi:lysophospholipase L1-like esterase
MKRQRLRWLAGPLVALLTLAIMLVIGELYFRYGVHKSDSVDLTLMAKHWKEECWTPIFTVNSEFQGKSYKIDYRDRTWADADVQGKKKIMIIGDSFVAGHGVCNAKDRFSDILQSKLGDGYAVFNLGVNGWGTPEETFYPLLYPYKPDIIVLSYFVNDINNAIKIVRGNDAIPNPPPAPDWLANTPLKDSYLVDFVYWQIVYKRQFAESLGKIWQVHLDAYSDPKVWAEHEKEIMQVIDWSKKINAPLVVITWPMLDNMNLSATQIQKVDDLLKANNIPFVSASDLFRNDPPESIVVNNIDSHPNENAHKQMAEALYTALQPYLK